MDGKFEEIIQEQHLRNDRVLWLTLSDMNKTDFKNLYFICNILSSIPYELNSKTQLCLQISESFQISYFSEKETFHLKHFDGSFDEKFDNGRKISCLYFCNLDEDDKAEEGTVKLEVEDQKMEITTHADCLLLLKSRKVSYEICKNMRKRFIVRFWIQGPADFINKEI